MRKEIENWWKQGKNDLEKARVLCISGNYDGTAFYCQQAVEKILKCLILYKTNARNVEGHSLIYLGKQAGIPQSFFSGLKRLSPQYVISRYPDMSEEVPYELYDKSLAEEFIRIAEGVLQWIEKRLQ